MSQSSEACEHGVEGFCMQCCRVGEGKAVEKPRVRTNRCGACGEGRHEDCSGWCFCTCEYNR
jgi:hypothetical protein